MQQFSIVCTRQDVSESACHSFEPITVSFMESI
jgi:hypothetical protein